MQAEKAEQGHVSLPLCDFGEVFLVGVASIIRHSYSFGRKKNPFCPVRGRTFGLLDVIEKRTKDISNFASVLANFDLKGGFSFLVLLQLVHKTLAY